ncbi:MAG: hypothetical protein PHQ48_07070 [Acidobacteriota bacterium]|nr:hypothetical protein [Acidobacteriota bacterium]
MRKISPVIVLWALFFTTFACGRKGQLVEPVPKIPQPVRDLAVVQRGEKLIFNWTLPQVYLNGDPLEISGVDILGLEVQGDTNTTSSEQQLIKHFAKYSKPLSELRIGQFQMGNNQASLQLDIQASVGKKYLFGLKIKGKKGGWSEVSNLVELTPELLPLPPSRLKGEIFEDKIILSWQPPVYCLDGVTPPQEVQFNIYRSQDGGFTQLNQTPFSEPRFEDRNFDFSATYSYKVRAGFRRGRQFKESADSEILKITVVDIFPPRTPEEIKAIIGEEGVTLSWLPNQEEDLAGYRVYRLKEGEPEPVFLTAELLKTPVFLDRSVEKNCLYVYSIRAVDSSGNESPPEEIRITT